MSAKQFGSSNAPKTSRRSISLALKLQVIQRLESGERQVDVSKSYGLSESTVRTIMTNADRIKSCALSTSKLSQTKVTRTRNCLLEKMESNLRQWIDDQHQHGVSLTQNVIMEKARNIFRQLQSEEGDGTESFSASRGWFDRFKRRCSLQNFNMAIEPPSIDTQAAGEFSITFKNIIERSMYPPQLVFNVDETGLFWKRLPSRTFKEEEIDAKEGKDRLSLLLGGNAAGDFKIQPMVVYYTETPREMKGFSKFHLPVIWKSNKKAWVSADIFQQWFVSHFCPSVKQYCERNNLKQSVLLILDRASCHPQNLDSIRTCIPVEIIYLPHNTSTLIQPMDQGVISNFKAYYIRRIFKQIIEETDGEDKEAIIHYWKNYNIMKALDNIKEAWEEISQNLMNAVWKNLWPAISCSDLEFETITTIIENIVALTNTSELQEIHAEEITELIRSHSENLTNDELKELMEQNVQSDDEETDEGDSPEKNLSAEFLQYSIGHIMDIMNQFSENDPDWERSRQAKRGVFDAISCYRELLRKRRQSQTNLEATREVQVLKIPKIEYDSDPLDVQEFSL